MPGSGAGMGGWGWGSNAAQGLMLQHLLLLQATVLTSDFTSRKMAAIKHRSTDSEIQDLGRDMVSLIPHFEEMS